MHSTISLREPWIRVGGSLGPWEGSSRGHEKKEDEHVENKHRCSGENTLSVLNEQLWKWNIGSNLYRDEQNLIVV